MDASSSASSCSDNAGYELGSDPQTHSATSVISALYAFMLITIGMAIPITEALIDEWMTSHYVAVFNVYLYLVASIVLVYLQLWHVFIPAYKTRQREHRLRQILSSPNIYSIQPNFESNTNQESDVSLGDVTVTLEASSDQAEQSNANVTLSNPCESFVSYNLQPSDTSDARPEAACHPDDSFHRPMERRNASISLAKDIYNYMATMQGTASFSHEVTSFYMRLGLLFFAIGNIVYLGLQIEFIHASHIKNCPRFSQELDYPYYFWLLFLLVQSFFLFKNKDLVVSNHLDLVRFGLMHVAATNVCTWVRVLVFEVMEAIHESNQHTRCPTSWWKETEASYLIKAAGPQTCPEECLKYMSDVKNEENDINTDGNTTTNCDDLTPLLHQLSPILFPLVLEYSLVGAAAMLSMYESVDFLLTKSVKDVLRSAVRKSHFSMRRQNQAPLENRNTHDDPDASLSKSRTGMFFGFVVLAGVVISIILSLYWESQERAHQADLAFLITDLGVIALLNVSVVIACVKFYSLAYASTRDNKIDSILLFISLSGLCMLELFTFVACIITMYEQGIITEVILDVVCSFASIMQGTLQTIFIIDGMHRYIQSDRQLQSKPGRSTVTFLITVNVALWIFKTIQEKKLSVAGEGEIFGDVAWAIIMNTCLPLLLFYRFHSSICLAHIWHSAYVREEDPYSPEDLAVDVVTHAQRAPLGRGRGERHAQ